jgi:hypothetical protein
MSAFTHRHYEAIAEIIADVDIAVAGYAITREEAHEVMCRSLELLFEEDNPKFSLVRFRRACGKRGR